MRSTENRNYKRTKGFTLIELLVVISIIGILAALGIAGYAAAKRQARDARRLGDIRTIMTALEQYYADNQRYPNSSLSPCRSDGWCCSSNDGGTSGWIGDGFPPYMGGGIPEQLGGLQSHCFNSVGIASSLQRYTIDYSLEAISSNAIGTLSVSNLSTPTRHRYTITSPE